jgi:hypothetical protein
VAGDHGRRADEEGDGVALGSSTCGGGVPLSRGVAVVSARLCTHVPTWRRRSCCVLACTTCRAATTASIGGEGEHATGVGRSGGGEEGEAPAAGMWVPP